MHTISKIPPQKTPAQNTRKRRLLYLWFPFLAAEVRTRSQLKINPKLETQPFALATLNKGTERLVSLNAHAAAEGLKAGQSLADARALVSNLVTQTTDPARTQAFLKTLARWAERFTPLVGIDGPRLSAPVGSNQHDALVLDIVGIAHLFGGERAMLATVQQAFSRFGLTVQACITDTKAAARALCIYKPERQIIATGKIFEAIKDLSVHALEPTAVAAKQLAHLGINFLEQIMNLPSAGLARRFGLDLVERLNQMLGRSADPVSPITMQRPLAVRLGFPEPLSLQDDILAAAERLGEHLLQRLQQQGQGLRQVRLVLTSPNGAKQSIHLGFTAPCQDLAVLMRLLEPKIALVESEFGFDEIRIQATQTGACLQKQSSLLSDDQSQQQNALSLLFNTLGNRIGFQHIRRFRPVETHLPEKRFALTADLKADPEAATPEMTSNSRPLSCFQPEPLPLDPTTNCQQPPQSFTWRRKARHVRCAVGPERISPPWWQRAEGWDKGTRDYWRVQTQEGDWLWLFTLPQHRSQASWFVAGQFQ